ncbi:response regulator transcription factor [Fulvivirga sedimenti]|uniref:LuxR C-terminal-related transcriptional regulator n=1 Tax=Fulvivirga sedimenti TaxID=2879465 RepID=A0A9X1HPL0_9BACT|nr:LuxR C-terminal-related transcriptional regulator [Fulvivirga sedimenti]MCA6074830.1 LuxR C-terminal-related transcriptional regulator [Fulvivirga sedimenti]MCA6076007.1 LuxR C-terminal-related transcriptional regulator [Fulvivirga sedimenti]MCA6077135.1 LuxR C-terminal-related transcriptional regulator [Fulvivirga sedimenti]
MNNHNNFLDIFRAIGKQDYVVHDRNYIPEILENPIVGGLWSVGPWFCFIANIFTKKLELVTGNSQQVIGYSHHEILQNNERFVEAFIYPPDFPFITSIIGRAMMYINSVPDDEKESVYVVFQNRSNHKNGSVITTQNQNIPLVFDENRVPFVFANIITDISHLEISNLPQATLFNQKRNEHFHLDMKHMELRPSEDLFTSREKEILRHLIRGEDSKEISEALNISYETVRTHRKNILKKADVHSTVELISFLMKNNTNI